MRIYFNDGTYEDFFDTDTLSQRVASFSTLLRERLGTDVECVFNDIIRDKDIHNKTLREDIMDILDSAMNAIDDNLSEIL